jgi:alpha-methylacyl-CoA racemase
VDREQATGGPLSGLRFVEIAGIGPAPLVCMVLADLGATGIRIDSPRPGLTMGDPARDTTRRGRPSITLDLRDRDDREQALGLITSADVLVEGLRPGAMERLALGPDECHAVNPGLVYARMTGWGQDGPYARVAGHDLTYLAAAGVLAHIGRRDQPPTPPLNLVADYGGGAMLCLVGLLAALWETQRTGLGQVVDAAMIDGSALIMSLFHSMRNQGLWSTERGVNILDSGAPFYDVYRTADGGWLAVACLEPAFYAEWLRVSGLADEDLPAQYDIAGWPRLREAFAKAIAARTRDEWADVAHGTDACAEVVLSMDEAMHHPQLAARSTMIDVAGHGGDMQAAPAPRFSRTPGRIRTIAEVNELLDAWGLAASSD